jgi:hypothetical protein
MRKLVMIVVGLGVLASAAERKPSQKFLACLRGRLTWRWQCKMD